MPGPGAFPSSPSESASDKYPPSLSKKDTPSTTSARSDEQPTLAKYRSAFSTHTFASLPSLEVPYDELDGDDEDLVLGRLPKLLLFGPSGAFRAAHSADNSRYRALRKLNAVLREHGLSELTFHDYVRALRIFVGLVRRRAREKEVKRRARVREMKNAEREAAEGLAASRRFSGDARDSPPSSLRPPSRDDSASAGSACGLPGGSSRSLGSAPPVSLRKLGSLRIELGLSEDSSFAERPSSEPSPGTLASFSSRASRFVHSGQGRPVVSVLRSLRSGAASGQDRVITHRDAPCTPNPRRGSGGSITGLHIAVLHHMLRHAESIYGLPLNAASGPRTSVLGFTDRNIVIRRTGIEPEGLRCAEFRSDAFLPAHYVAVDRRIRAVVVCVRGTANLIDSLTDVAATLDPLNIVPSECVTELSKAAASNEQNGPANVISGAKGSGACCNAGEPVAVGDDEEIPMIRGYGHAGVLRSARTLFERVSPVVLDALASNEGYDVLVTGHSLGGAVGAIVALIMREDPRFPRARAIAIGPPPCVSREIAEDANDTVVSVVNGADIVPRLSVQTLIPYFTTCRYVAGLGKLQKRAIDWGMHRVAVDWDELMEMSRREQAEKREELKSKQLYVPGVVLQLVEPNEVKRLDAALLHLYGDVKVDIIRVPRTDFARLHRERGMFLSHAPHRYRANLTAALKGSGGVPLRRTENTGGLLSALARLPTSQVLTSSDMDESGESGESNGASRHGCKAHSSIDTRTLEF